MPAIFHQGRRIPASTAKQAKGVRGANPPGERTLSAAIGALCDDAMAVEEVVNDYRDRRNDGSVAQRHARLECVRQTALAVRSSAARAIEAIAATVAGRD